MLTPFFFIWNSDRNHRSLGHHQACLYIVASWGWPWPDSLVNKPKPPRCRRGVRLPPRCIGIHKMAWISSSDYRGDMYWPYKLDWSTTCDDNVHSQSASVDQNGNALTRCVRAETSHSCHNSIRNARICIVRKPSSMLLLRVLRGQRVFG